MIYYIADIHFNDKTVFNKCSRPFRNLKDYENEIIRRWNNKVSPDDIVYVLGDIAEDRFFQAIEIIKHLKGHKVLIIGNHDLLILDKIKESGAFEIIEFMLLINDNERKVCLCHYPLMDWVEFNRGGYHIYGHIHNKTIKQGNAYVDIKNYFKDKLAYNAGVDVTGFEPVTLNEMIEMKEKNKNEPYIN